MELNKSEVQALERTADADAIQILSDLELALIGGGIGETIL
jgi:hypothetical protein